MDQNLAAQPLSFRAFREEVEGPRTLPRSSAAAKKVGGEGQRIYMYI